MSFTSRIGYAIRHPGSILLWLERKMKRRAIIASEGFFGNDLLDWILTFVGTAVLFLVTALAPMFIGIELRESMNPSLLKMAQWAGILTGGATTFMWFYFWDILYPHRFDRLIVCMYRAQTNPRERATYRIETHVDDPVCCRDGSLVGAPILWVWRHPFFGTTVRNGLRYTLRRSDHMLVVRDRVGGRLHAGPNDPDYFDCKYFLLRLVTDMRSIAKLWGIEYTWRFVMVELLERSSTDVFVRTPAVEIDPAPLPQEILDQLRAARDRQGATTPDSPPSIELNEHVRQHGPNMRLIPRRPR